MVLLHVKGKEEFIFEATTDTKVDDVTRQISETHNTRLRLRTSLELVQAYLKAVSEQKEGEPGESVLESITKASLSAASILSDEKVKQRESIDVSALESAIHELEEATSELPADFVEQGPDSIKGLLDASTCTLWFASKPMERGVDDAGDDVLLAKYFGKNEKSKVIVKLSKSRTLPPVRENPVDEATHKSMLSYYYRKQEEQKALAKNRDDSYLNSQWANSRGLKEGFHGLESVTWRVQ